MSKKTIGETDPKKSVSHLKTLKEIGAQVYKARNHKNLSIENLAEKSGTSFVWINNLEKGILENASVKKLYQITEALGIELNISSEFKIEL